MSRGFQWAEDSVSSRENTLTNAVAAKASKSPMCLELLYELHELLEVKRVQQALELIQSAEADTAKQLASAQGLSASQQVIEDLVELGTRDKDGRA